MDINVEELLQKQKELLQQYEAIATVLKLFNVNSVTDTSDLPTTKKVARAAGFPATAPKDEQVIWLFENVLIGAMKMPDVQEAYNKASGLKKPSDISIFVRNLKKAGKIVKVKYNSRHDLSYWGIPQWLDDNGFKKEFAPKNEVIDFSTAIIERD